MGKTAGIHAMIDISDGLSTDLNRICQRSGVGALIEAQSIPLSKAAQQSARPVESALHDGEDFELLFTLPQQELERLLQHWPFAVPITSIGCITDGSNAKIRQKDGRVLNLEAGGYDHLARENRI